MYKLLRYTEKIWDYPSLKNVAIIGGQHLMDSTLEIFRLFQKRGLKPENAFILGKAYSSSTEVFNDLASGGFQVNPQSFTFDSHEPYDKTYDEIVKEFIFQSLNSINFKEIKSLIIIDDGGYVMKHILAVFHQLPNVYCAGVEQTSSGYSSLKNLKIPFPIVNVARSEAKLLLETPFIAQSLIDRLRELAPLAYSNKNILILGKGTLGIALKNFFLKGSCVNFYDPKIHDEAEIIPMLQESDVIIGCSGTTSISYEHYQYLKRGAILASGSSSDREFEAYKFRRLFGKMENPHTNYKSENLTLLQAGFPINFWNTRFNISLQKMQITMALLVSGVFQSLTLKNEKNGIISIDEEAQRSLIQEFKKIKSAHFHAGV